MVIGRESLKTKKAFPRKNVCFCRYIDKICVRDVFFSDNPLKTAP